jgi:hypothetical protein
MYIQKYETWVEVASLGSRSMSRGAIPAPLMGTLEEVARLEGEAEADRCDRAFASNLVQRAGAREGDAWFTKFLLALPGIPVYVAYFLAFAWLSGHWPLGDLDAPMLVILNVVPAVAGGFASALLWASEAGDDAWWVGGALGMFVLIADGFVFTKSGFLWGAFVHAVFGTFILLVLIGLVLGTLGESPGQVVADGLRRRHQRQQMTRWEPWHIAAGVGAFGLLLALLGAIRISL